MELCWAPLQQSNSGCRGIMINNSVLVSLDYCVQVFFFSFFGLHTHKRIFSISLTYNINDNIYLAHYGV